MTIGMLCAGERIDAAVAVVLAVARADQPGEDQRDHAALHVHHRGAGEIDMAVAEAEIRAELGEPAAAPDPVAEERIHDRADAAAIDHERGELPALGGGAGRNRRRRIHEHHLEEEERKGGGVIAGALQQEPVPAEEAERLSEEVHRELVVQPAVAAQRCRWGRGRRT